MTKFTAVLSISLIIFLFSVGLSLVWYSGLFEDQTLELVKEVSNPEVIQTTTCELLEKPDFYDGKLVRFDSTAFLNGFGEIILSPKDCYLNVADHTFRLARMEIGETDSSNKVLRSSIDAIKRLSNGENKEVDVLVLGRASKTRDSKNRIDVSIQPSFIEFISPQRALVPKAAG